MGTNINKKNKNKKRLKRLCFKISGSRNICQTEMKHILIVKCFKYVPLIYPKLFYNYAPLHDGNVFEFTGVLLFFEWRIVYAQSGGGGRGRLQVG